jgi:hypothetical protein
VTLPLMLELLAAYVITCGLALWLASKLLP